MDRTELAMLLALADAEGLMALSAAHVARMAPRQAAAPAAETTRNVAVIPVTGVLVNRSMAGWFGTIPGQDQLRARIATAAADTTIGAIVLHVDSPGGTVAGTAETAAAVRAAAAVKPVVAVVDALAASAAYWIAAQASELVVVPNGEVGSIGVMAMHQDWSRFYDRLGVTPTVITSSQFKAERTPFAPLSDAARADIQASVAEADAAFVADVALGRRVTADRVLADFGQGRVVGAARAVQLGMADAVATLPETIARLAGGAPVRRRRSAVAFV